MIMAVDLPRYEDLPVTPEAPPHSSWGLWGDTDGLGCLNLLTEERIRRAVGTVRDGLSIALNASLDAFQRPLFERERYTHEVSELGRGMVRDEVLSNFNTQSSSQWDGFRHMRSRWYGFYNGLDEMELGVDAWAKKGIVGRGVVLDVSTWRAQQGRPFDFATPDPITVEDLESVADESGVTVETGDILIVHTGWLDWARTQPALEVGCAPGLRPGRDMLAYLWNKHVAAVVSDTPSVEVWPPAAFATVEQRERAKHEPEAIVDVFMHSELLALLGLPLGELWDTGRLAECLRERGRSDFLLVSVPLNLPNGVASVSNAVAIL